MNNRLASIRDNEEKSHTEIYLKEKLYDSDTWLKKPIKTVQDIIYEGNHICCKEGSILIIKKIRWSFTSDWGNVAKL